MAKKSAPKKAKKTATKMTAKKVKEIVEKELQYNKQKVKKLHLAF